MAATHCRDCGAPLTFTRAQVMSFCRPGNWLPKRCPDCTRAHRQRRDAARLSPYDPRWRPDAAHERD